MTEASEDLATRVARDLVIDDWLWVEEAVRQRHGQPFARHEDVYGLAYELLRDAIEADLRGRAPESVRARSEVRA